ncbi:MULTISPECIES: LLM class flavin-dependent oxidoreductase [unclassified Mesorhizobium]|uniref:LLM class flavin-dependent oxidoreductase n=1 Tax=unclassified Mesorhizobium TaxID=325217 RepID=UPI000FD82CF9|nr:MULTISPECIES: LLM class flavin-dependent oxidoreductase [unclassified Mesorhizobium]TGT73452.1 LLM class flavin-dependent oxidoreductase [Mesorhizobium sp. M2E.F.Ca.ET.166.01.1.1]TGV99968.1 LLM class flavin-dependent oxidoreductase [Mesorhizobium sp. M2E.F.Ca.ET.154.01.1.1]
MHLAISLNIAAANGHDILDFGQISAFVQKAEAAGVDMVIISDSADEPSTSPFEATTLLAALATVTNRIGLVASASTLAHQPYNLARRFASLDVISHGRVGWNATLRQNPCEAANFSRPEGFSDDDFRRRAEEYIGIVRGLWRGWDADALLFDKAGGRFHDPGKMHFLDHKGEFFSVRGPLNVARSPQDTPVLLMSGLNETDRDFASRVADVILIEEQSVEAANAATADLRRRALAADRKPEGVKVLLTVAIESEPPIDGLRSLLGSSGCDGFNLVLPADVAALQNFTDRVLPELQHHSLAGRGQHGATLRDHLGLGEGGAR